VGKQSGDQQKKVTTSRRLFTRANVFSDEKLRGRLELFASRVPALIWTDRQVANDRDL
jgi:hypothetical protein